MSGRLGAFDESCLTSTVRNTSGRTQFFGFLAPHGRTLEDGESFTVFGNILDALWQGMRISGERARQAFYAAMNRGDIEIVQTPSPILLDSGNGNTKMLELTNGSLSAVNPCWDTSDSLDVLAPP
jgi:hypothetical protein